MSEWMSLVVVYWALWAVDGARGGTRRSFTIVAGRSRRRVWVRYERWHWPSFLPTSWRIATADPPLSLSPAGIANVPRGSAGRPVETPPAIRAWRWKDVRHVGVVNGWVYINGSPFCPDTGHVPPRELLALAESREEERPRRIDAIMRRWFRPVHLRRRACVLEKRTAAVAACNAASLILGLGVSLYVLGDVASSLQEEQAAAIANLLPATLAAWLLVHAAAVVIAWRTLRRLPPAGADRRRTSLAAGLLLPPQAHKLRALLGEAYFPPHHPLAAVVAFGDREDRAAFGFQVLADIRWPLPPAGPDAALAAEIANGFGHALENHATRVLRETNVDAALLLAAPAADSPASCRYCPRCKDQFTAGAVGCPHGIDLLPLSSTGDERHE